MFVGMEAMYLSNLDAPNGFANGSMGIIRAIYLDSREVVDPNLPYIQLKYLPACVAFEPYRQTGRLPQLDDLPNGSFPVFAREETFAIPDNVTKTASIHRTQFDIIPAYAFTNDKSQGQTINPVIVDLTKTAYKDGPQPSREGYYVAMSRGSGADNIRILRPVAQNMLDLLKKGPSEFIRRHDKLLQNHHDITKAKWEAGTFFWD